MEIGNPNGLICFFGDCSEPSRDAEFNRWYNEVHIPDVLEPGIFTACTRFEHRTAGAADLAPQYLAVYETERTDPWQALQEIRPYVGELREQGRISPDAIARMSAVFRPAGGFQGSVLPTGPTEIYIELVAANLQAPVQSVSTWYREIYLRDVLGTGLYDRGSLWQADSDDPTQPPLMALFEAQASDLPSIVEQLAQARLRWQTAGRIPSFVELQLAAGYRPIFSYSRPTV